MKEFKFCGEITEYVEIPVMVCETQKEMVNEIYEVREVSFNDYVYEEVESIEFNRQCAIKERKEHGYSAWFYDEQIRSVIGTSDETSIYIIYKDGSKYFETFGERQGKFKRYGIKAAVIETAFEYTVYGDFAVTDNGDISIEESDIEEYGVYARQYDVKEQDEQEVSETETNETTAETETAETAEQETVEGISKTETTTETDDSGFEYYSVEVAYEVIKDEIRSALFTSYLLALKVAKDFTDMWDGDKAIVTEVSLMIRNDRQPESEHDKRILETETAEIERRCVPYHDWVLSGYVSKEDRQVVNA